MSEFRVTVNPQHLAHLQRVTTPELFRESTRRLLAKGAITGENEGKGVAPVDTGRLRASITHQIDPAPAPTWSRYGTNVKYGLHLDQPVTRNPHYRAGPRKGQSTKGWLTATLRKVKAFVDDEIVREIVRIEARWRGGA